MLQYLSSFFGRPCSALLLIGSLALAGCGGGGSSQDQAIAQPVSLPQGTPIVAAQKAWAWVPFDDAHCANGAATGLGVNLNAASSKVLIYFAGGGACWSESTCYQLNTAVHFSTGYGAADFAIEAGNPAYLAQPGGLFDRSAAGNPFKDYNYVYVPYCTGDLHAGSNIVHYGAHTAAHVGYNNVAAYLRRLVPTFASADRIVLAGSSAGGFGATFNLWQVHSAFGAVRVDLINDSGPILPPSTLALGNGLLNVGGIQWNLAAALPAGCAQCATQLDALYGFYAGALPTSRIALLTYTEDPTLSAYFGLTTPQFSIGLIGLLAEQFMPYANSRYFAATGPSHVLWFSPTLTVNGVSLPQFLAGMESDDPAWASVHP